MYAVFWDYPTTYEFHVYPICTVKFMYSEKATKIFEISTIPLSYVVPVKSKVEISQNFVAFSEYKNFNVQCYSPPKKSGAGKKIHLLEKANQQQINKAVLSVEYSSG